MNKTTLLEAIKATHRNGYCGQPMYDIDVTMLLKEHKSSNKSRSIGLRKTKRGFSFQSYDLYKTLELFCVEGFISHPNQEMYEN